MSNDSLVSLWSRYSLILLPLKVGRAVHLALEGKSIVWKDPGAIKMLAVCCYMSLLTLHMLRHTELKSPGNIGRVVFI